MTSGKGIGSFIGATRWAALAAVIVAVTWTAAPQAGSQGPRQALEARLEGPALVDALREGGLTVLMRHMATDDFVPERGEHSDPDCATQRNLTDAGRGQARVVGEAIKKLGIQIGAVLTSPYCRCVETGMLAFGRAQQDPELGVFDKLEGAEKDVRAKRIRRLLNEAPTRPDNAVLITHTGTLLYTFGLETQPEGIAHVFRPMEFGQAIYLGSVIPDEWPELAAAAPGGS